MLKKYLFLFLLFSFAFANAQNNKIVIPAAERLEMYLPLLKGKAVAVFANQTSVVKNTHIVDTLLNLGINIVKIFGPEHGFRGKADAGEEVNNSIDKKTGIQITSLYGTHKKPTIDDLKNIDIVVFDIQDVGVRFYTFISSLEYVLEACLENKKPLLILDRPNPNGFYIDGPVLNKKFKSFVGMQAVPIVYGMTIGEYTQMIASENVLSEEANKNYRYKNSIENEAKIPFLLRIITCKNYDHNTKYILPINPSPNLREMQSIYLYPSIALFEGTVISEGRGTDKPFQKFGHPLLPNNLFSFTPKPNDGAKTGKCFNQVCYGWNLGTNTNNTSSPIQTNIELQYLIKAYKLYPQKDSFFLANNFFNKLAGNDILMNQIKNGTSETEIRKSWQKDLIKFKAVRKKYLLYKDFE